MAEIGIAASIVGISEFALILSKNLYKFGCKALAAREQTERVARNLSHYAQVISLLGDRLDEDEPIHSKKGLDLAVELCAESSALLEKVEKLLPNRDDGGDIPWTARLAWAFKKSRIDVLIGEIEYMKTTVNLLVQVLYAGKKVRSYRRKRSKHSSRTKDAQKAANVQTRQAEIALIEQLYAVQALPQLINEAKQERQTLLDTDHWPRGEAEKDQSSETSSITVAESIAQPLELLSLDTDMTNDDKLLIARTQSPMLIEQLLSEWTNLDDAQPADREGKREAKDAAATNAEDAGRAVRDGPRRARSEEKNTEIEARQGREKETARKEQPLDWVIEWAERDDRRRARKEKKDAEVEAENAETVARDDRRRARKEKEEAELEARQEREKEQASKEQELKDQWLEERRIRRAKRDKRREEEDERVYAEQRRKEREAERAARESEAVNEHLLRSKNTQNPTKSDRVSSILAGDGKQEWTRDENNPGTFVRKMSMREVFKIWREISKN